MSEPASTAAGSVAAWKIGAGILGIGVVASALGFLVLLPRTAKEAALRAMATMCGSVMFGPFLALAARSRWPEPFHAAEAMATQLGAEAWVGLLAASAPWLALGGLPCWWLLGAAALWFDKRRGKDIGELAADARADVKAALP